MSVILQQSTQFPKIGISNKNINLHGKPSCFFLARLTLDLQIFNISQVSRIKYIYFIIFETFLKIRAHVWAIFEILCSPPSHVVFEFWIGGDSVSETAHSRHWLKPTTNPWKSRSSLIKISCGFSNIWKNLTNPSWIYLLKLC